MNFALQTSEPKAVVDFMKSHVSIAIIQITVVTFELRFRSFDRSQNLSSRVLVYSLVCT